MKPSWPWAFVFPIAASVAQDMPKDEVKRAVVPTAAVSSFAADEIAGFEEYPPRIQRIIEAAAELTRLNLTYKFGSSDPKEGGMDCSGTIYHLLQGSGIKETPRQSDEICRWIMRESHLCRTEGVEKLTDSAFSSLQPGDLLFWTGTYPASELRNPPISHVMIYVGKRKRDGKAVVFGASDGRSYDGQVRCGVSVFDFAIPKPGGKSQFYGYGPLPAAKD